MNPTKTGMSTSSPEVKGARVDGMYYRALVTGSMGVIVPIQKTLADQRQLAYEMAKSYLKEQFGILGETHKISIEPLSKIGESLAFNVVFEVFQENDA